MSHAYDDGHQNIVGVDLVDAVVETMRRRNETRPGMAYAVEAPWIHLLAVAYC